MIAAHTLTEIGIDRRDIDIIAREKSQSIIGGAQYLHQPIFEDQEPFGTLDVVQLGNSEGYAYKVYGDSSVPTSWSDHHQTVTAWNLNDTYNRLWNQWYSRISTEEVDAESVRELAGSHQYEKVISTIPADALCGNPVHTFPTAQMLLIPCAPPLPIPDVIIYSGRLSDPWHRISNIFGHHWAEYTPERAGEAFLGDPHSNKLCSVKPMGTDCDCCASLGVLRVGRFGTWDRKVLLHDVPAQVREGMQR